QFSDTPDAAPLILWASTPLSVGDTDVTDLNIALKKGFTISGRVEFDGTERPSAEQLSETAIYIQMVDSETASVDLPRAKLDATDHFTPIALPAARYVLHVVGAGDRWSLKSAMAGDREIAG